MALTANAAFAVDKLRAGNWGLVSQSGSLIGALLSRADARGIGFSRLISVGNEVDLAVGEIADLLVDDPKTKAILLFMETLRDGERLARAARRAHAAGKPVVAYKLGRSDIGQELAKSHTGAIAGSDATFDAFCRRHGIARVSMFESLVDVPALLVDRPPADVASASRSPTTTGGGAAMVVDNMAMAGLDIADPPQALVDWLKPLGIAAGEGKLVDLTLAGAKPEIVAGTIERLLADDDNDAAIFVVGSSAQFNPELAVEPLLKLRQLDEAVRRVADAGGRKVAGVADGGRRAGVPSSRILRRGDGALPAATDAAARCRRSPSRRRRRATRSRPAAHRASTSAARGDSSRRSACRWPSRWPCPMRGASRRRSRRSAGRSRSRSCRPTSLTRPRRAAWRSACRTARPPPWRRARSRSA